MRIQLSSSQFLASIVRKHTTNLHFTTTIKTHNPSSPLNTDANPSSTPEIEKKHVHRVYDAIAPHFSATRFAKWPKVSSFLNNLPSGSVILDAGCGNGKYLGLNPNCFVIGCDISAPLVQICSDKGHEVLVADAVNLPYRSAYGDAAILIAVLHHLSTEHRRMKAIDELVRVVKKGGHVLITVWAVEQQDRSLVDKWTPVMGEYVVDEVKEFGSVCQQEYFVPWHLPYHRAAAAAAESGDSVESGFGRKDDRKGAIVYDRYYHVFCESELERLICGMKNAVIVDQFYDKSNWCVILEKT
ncbi:hypothetical protein QVD17_02164 [Tagetes erecta]|uniref:Methyltransferase type 11 domain-containing protein n=1 Tax=Tagetes erecta TaxID=13708 RepID=A0AAD8L636_TARER|nr:hypothetical protein QVD17_02164 [Tagetes erecta]